MNTQLWTTWKLGLLALLGYLILPNQADASHFRGGTLSYKYISGRTVEFTVEAYINAFTTPCTNNSCVGQNYGLGTIVTGDGSSVNIPSKIVAYTRTRNSPIEGFYTVRATGIRHTYSGTATTYIAYFSSCCWIGGIPNASGGWHLQIQVHLNGNNDPVINSPTYLTWCVGVPWTQNVNASDPDRDPITYRLGQLTQGGRTIGYNPPSGMTIDQAGVIKWQNPQGKYYVVTVIVSDNRGATTYRDFLLELVSATECSNKAPTLVANPPSITVAGGQAACTNVTATDPDAGQKLTWFDISPTKAGATPKPVGSFASPTTFRYCWTPAKADEGTTHGILFTVIDDHPRVKLTAQAQFNITVLSGRPPTITVTPSGNTKNIDELKTLTFSVKAADPDGNGINTFTATGVPAFCKATKVGTDTFTIVCIPGANDGGKTGKITFTAVDKDGKPKTTTLDVTINAIEANRPPTITVTPSGNTKTVDENKSVKFTVKTVDPDGQPISGFTLKNLPPFCTQKAISATEIEVTCNPGPNDGAIGGKDYKLTFEATDTNSTPGKTTIEVIVKVNDVNRPPTVTDPGALTAEEDKPFKYTIKASDPDGDKITYSMTGLPAGATIDPATGEINWTPGQADVGDHTATITVTDSRGSKTEIKVKLTVKNINDNPTITSNAPTQAEEDKEYTYTPTIKDDDPGDAGKHTFKFTKNPTGAKIDPATGKITWTPGDNDVKAGSRDFEVEVCDPAGGCVKETWTVNVKNINDKPVLTGTPPKEAFLNEEITYKPKVTDNDPSDTFTWTLKKGPGSIDPATGKLTWKPTTNDVGTEVEFEIEVCDNGTPKLCATQTFKIPVKQKCRTDIECQGKQICVLVGTDRICIEQGCADQSPKCATAGELCKDGTCGTNPCDSKLCANDEICRTTDGKCVKSCANVKCAADERCVDGACTKDDCAKTGTVCKADELCDITDPSKPACVKNPCQSGSCKHGRVCYEGGICVDDPCATITCPNVTERCVAGQCIDRQNCKVDVDCPTDQICIKGKCYEPGCHTKTPQCPKTEQQCTDGKCEENLCLGANPKQCAQDEFCRGSDGACVKPCSNVTCPSGEFCEDGACKKDPCGNVTCDAGKICVNGDCEKDNCSGGTASCKHGRVCQPNLNTCVTDACTGVKCPDGKQICKNGQCQTPPKCVFDTDCPGSQLCINGKCETNGCGTNNTCPNGKICQNGQCLKDPCEGVQCATGQFCKAGKCIGSCAGIFCKQGEICIEGKCTEDPCKNANCMADEICVSGTCVKNTCKQDSCKGKRICLGDKCIDDPCTGLQCESGHQCKDGQCTGDRSCKVDADCPGESICVESKCVQPGCYKEACTGDKLCLKGQCTDNPCASKTCGAGETCRPTDGKCTKNCTTCAVGKVCVDGVCQDDPCAGVTCSAGERCDAGKCVKDICEDPKTVTCKYKRDCSKESCGDDPCLGVKCADGSTCKDGVCYEPKKADPEPEPTQDAGTTPEAEHTVLDKNINNDNGPKDYGPPLLVSGGCALSVLDSEKPMSGLFMLFCFLGLLFVATRRRK